MRSCKEAVLKAAALSEKWEVKREKTLSLKLFWFMFPTHVIAHLLRNQLTYLLSLLGAKRRSNPIHIENSEITMLI